MEISVSFLPILSWISKYLATHLIIRARDKILRFISEVKFALQYILFIDLRFSIAMLSDDRFEILHWEAIMSLHRFKNTTMKANSRFIDSIGILEHYWLCRFISSDGPCPCSCSCPVLDKDSDMDMDINC
jgi:hypothetical protein